MRRRLLLPGLLLAATAALLLPGPGAGQAGGLNVDLKDPDTTSTPGHVKVTVALSGESWDGEKLPAGAFTATVDGRQAPMAKVDPLEATGRQVAVMLVVDTSGSMRAGDNISLARDAAVRLVNELPPGTKVGVVAFSDQPQVVQGLTADRARVRSAIASLQANGETALRDAVVQASRLLGRESGQRNLVLLSDGADTSSQASFDQTVAAVKRAKAAIYTLGLTAPAGEEQDPQALKNLARRAGGRAVTDLTGPQLAGLYQGIGRELASQYVIDVQLPQSTGTTVAFAVTVKAAGASGSAQRTLLIRQQATTQTPAVPSLSPAPALSRLEREQGRYLAALAAFVAVLLVGMVVLIARPGGGRPFRSLRQRLSPYSLTPAIVDHRPTTVFGSSELAGRATAMAETLVRRGNLEEAFLDRLEAAGLNMRVAEYVLVSLGSAFGFPLLVLAASRNFILALLAVPIGTIGPFLFLSIKASRRQAKFEEQLPATLQLLAGALRAGHSLLQAADTVVREADEPIAGEFQRVLTEARLGRPLEEAFDGMAKRMRSVDFAWTVMAINLQHQVGGNLAEVLGTVSGTIRDRYTLKRQIRSLSAEGRLSSVILTMLPLVMFVALLAFNPVFLAPLYTTRTGLLLLGGAAILMCIGVLWMRKLTEIKV
jgi:tight adherence protein B